MTTADEAPPKIDTAAALAAWDEYSAGEGVLPGTRSQYSSIAARFLTWLEPASVSLGEISPEQVEGFLDAQAIIPTTRTHYRSILRRFLDALVARGLLAANPAAGPCPVEPPLTADSLPDRFASFTGVERQATVDAAAAALLLHEIHLFTGGQGGRPAHVALCEAALDLGERYGVTALAWTDESPPDGPHDGQAPELPSIAPDDARPPESDG